MPAHLRRFNEPGHVHFRTISCPCRLGFFHHHGMKRIVIAALKRLQMAFNKCLSWRFESPTAEAMGHPSGSCGQAREPSEDTPEPSGEASDQSGEGSELFGETPEESGVALERSGESPGISGQAPG